MVVLSNPGTYGTRKCSSWCADIYKSKDPEYKHPELQHSKNPRIKKSKTPRIQNFPLLRNLASFLDFWIFGFFDFWAFGFLCFTVVFPICRNSSKIGFGKNGVCIGIYSAFKGWACRTGGDHIYIHICKHKYLHIYIYIRMHTYIRIYVEPYMRLYTCT